MYYGEKRAGPLYYEPRDSLSLSQKLKTNQDFIMHYISKVVECNNIYLPKIIIASCIWYLITDFYGPQFQTLMQIYR